jgi:hypothetical protein
MATDAKDKSIRKYQVFISSTFRELKAHREAAVRGIINAGHFPLALENYGPQPNDIETVIRQAIESSHFYIIILGSIYGSRPIGEQGELLPSYVEMEFDMAKDAGLEILVFVLDEKIAREQRKKLKHHKDKDMEEINNKKAYRKFRKRLTESANYFYSPFSKPDDIYPEVLAYFSKKHTVPGYIQEPEDAPDSEEYLQIYTGNPIVRAIGERLGGFGTVDARLADATQRKKAMAQAFDDMHGGDIHGNSFSEIFFESGSTILYIAKQLAHRLPIRLGGNTLTVRTNNALAYVYLWLCEDVMCHSVPEGPPDDKYGGMYGKLTDFAMVPDYNMPQLESYAPSAFKIVKKMSKGIFGSPKNNSKTLILGAASGLQLTNNITATYYGTGKSVGKHDEVMRKLRKCRGFHVGSYHNMLFKRSLYLSKAPTIVFIHDDKVDGEIKVGKCHFIFENAKSGKNAVTWNNFIETHPLSLWIACKKPTVRNTLKKFRSNLPNGWEFGAYNKRSENPIIIGHNKQFRDACADVNMYPYWKRKSASKP